MGIPKPWGHTNLLERLIPEIRQGTKAADAVYKLLYLESERQEGKWAERRLRGFA